MRSHMGASRGGCARSTIEDHGLQKQSWCRGCRWRGGTPGSTRPFRGKAPHGQRGCEDEQVCALTSTTALSVRTRWQRRSKWVRRSPGRVKDKYREARDVKKKPKPVPRNCGCEGRQIECSRDKERSCALRASCSARAARPFSPRAEGKPSTRT
eukprot:761588-Pleurochrysis_carterae.AAC.1